MPDTETFGFSALEEDLHGEAAGARVVERLVWVAARRAALDVRLEAGATMAAREEGLRLRDALDAAEAILRTRPHKRGH